MIINNELSVGEFSAFISYFNLLITPIFILGFITSQISRSTISLQRIQEVIADNKGEKNTLKESKIITKPIKGQIKFENVFL